MNTENLPPLVVIAGPTASGKSALAMALADLVPATIVNADSMQVYRDLRIVTARPSAADEARHPHRLFGHRDGAQPCSAAEWAAEAKTAIVGAQRDRRLPIVVGGTGLYIRTLLHGIAPVPPIDPMVRDSVRAMPPQAAFDRLAALDAPMAARLAARDTQRVARALEVVLSTGRSLAAWQAQSGDGIANAVRIVPTVLQPALAALEARIEQRLDTMIDAGGDEVRALVARGLSPALPVMRAIGVPEIAALQAGIMSRAEAWAAMRLATRQYAKRQRTWLANQLPIEWDRQLRTIDASNVQGIAILLSERALTP